MAEIEALAKYGGNAAEKQYPAPARRCSQNSTTTS